MTFGNLRQMPRRVRNTLLVSYKIVPALAARQSDRISSLRAVTKCADANGLRLVKKAE